MSGNRYLLDTNAPIALINGNPKLLELTSNADHVALSIITVIEFLSFTSLSEKDENLFHEFKDEAEIIDVNIDDILLLEKVISLRKQYKMKLPDCIMAASAISYNCHLISNDTGFNKILTLSVITF